MSAGRRRALGSPQNWCSDALRGERQGGPLSADDGISTAVERRDDVTVLTVDGVVDLATAPALEDLLAELVDEAPAGLVMDLTAVAFMASVGLRILAETHERLGGA